MRQKIKFEEFKKNEGVNYWLKMIGSSIIYKSGTTLFEAEITDAVDSLIKMGDRWFDLKDVNCFEILYVMWPEVKKAEKPKQKNVQETSEFQKWVQILENFRTLPPPYWNDNNLPYEYPYTWWGILPPPTARPEYYPYTVTSTGDCYPY